MVGTSGSGKTTLAKNIAQRLHIPHVELDELHWEANWVEAPDDVFRERLTKALENDSWVVDGNYGTVRDLILSRADMLVWLDFSLAVVMSRVTRRTFRRAFTGEELWHGNKELLRTALLSRDFISVVGTNYIPQEAAHLCTTLRSARACPHSEGASSLPSGGAGMAGGPLSVTLARPSRRIPAFHFFTMS